VSRGAGRQPKWTNKRLNEYLASVTHLHPRIPAKARRKPGEMNGLESRFVEEWIKPRLRGGEIVWWSYESKTLRLAPALGYTPDFEVQHADGRLAFYETKGRMMEDAWVKMKIAHHIQPVPIYLCKWSKSGGWSVTPVHQSEPLDGEDVA
jgi:hypothetical protein